MTGVIKNFYFMEKPPSRDMIMNIVASVIPFVGLSFGAMYLNDR